MSKTELSRNDVADRVRVISSRPTEDITVEERANEAIREEAEAGFELVNSSVAESSAEMAGEPFSSFTVLLQFREVA